MHDTRHDVVSGGSESALENHTARMLAMEREFLRRFPADGAPDPAGEPGVVVAGGLICWSSTAR